MNQISHKEDKALATKVFAGDRVAFDQFFESHFSRLYRFALSRLSGDQDATQEIVQLTLCQALRKMDTYRGEASLFTWLCQILRSQVSAHFKKQKTWNKRFVPIDDDPSIRGVMESLSIPEEQGPLGASLSAEAAQLVRTTLDYLPVKYGNALEWKYIEGLSVEAVAERLGLGVTAAQSLLARARKAFRDGFSTLHEAQTHGISE